MAATSKVPWDKLKTDTLRSICRDFGANTGELERREGMLEFLRKVETAGHEIDETAIVTVAESSSLATSASSTSSIHILDDDSLLYMFRVYRQTLFDEDKAENHRIFQRKRVCERWWYKLAHVCQRWRSLILGSASHLDLCLVCTYRTPVADMLAHSPPLPLVIDYFDAYYQVHANHEDEAGILIALEHRDRVRRIRLDVSSLFLPRLIAAIDKEFPMLEYLWIMPTDTDDWNMNVWILRTTFQAPRLRHLTLSDFALPIRSPLLTTEAGLVTLTLQAIKPFSNFSLNDLLQQLSLMHHLQSFAIDAPDNDVNEHLLTITHATLPNLRSFAFHGQSDYLEALLPHVTTPPLEKLYISLSDRPTLSVPNLLQFITATKNFTGRPSSTVLRFDVLTASVALYPDVGSTMYSLCLRIRDPAIDWRLAFAAYFLDALRPMLSEVVHLTLEHQGHITLHSPLWHNELDCIHWRKCLRTFGNVKTLSINTDLVKDVSRSLQLDDGVSSVDLLPKLNKLECYGSGNASDAFTPFIDARKDAGCPVTLVPFEHFPFRNNTIRPRIPFPFVHPFRI